MAKKKITTVTKTAPVSKDTKPTTVKKISPTGKTLSERLTDITDAYDKGRKEAESKYEEGRIKRMIAASYQRRSSGGPRRPSGLRGMRGFIGSEDK